MLFAGISKWQRKQRGLAAILPRLPGAAANLKSVEHIQDVLAHVSQLRSLRSKNDFGVQNWATALEKAALVNVGPAS